MHTEVMIKVGDSPDLTWKDGMIVSCCNSRRILQGHTERICKDRTAPATERDSEGKILHTSYVYDFYIKTHPIIVEVINPRELLEKNLITQVERTILRTDVDATGNSIDIRKLLRRKRRRNVMFINGEGREVFFKGTPHKTNNNPGENKRFSKAILNDVWNSIETKTPLRKANHRYQTLPTERIRNNITIKMSSMSRRNYRLRGLTKAQIDAIPIRYFGTDRQHHEAITGTTVSLIEGGNEARAFAIVRLDDITDIEANSYEQEEVGPQADVAYYKELGYSTPQARAKKDEDEAEGTLRFYDGPKRTNKIVWQNIISTPSQSDIVDKTIYVDKRSSSIHPKTVVEEIT